LPIAFDGSSVRGNIQPITVDSINDAAGEVAFLRQLAVYHVVVEFAAFTASSVFRGRGILFTGRQGSGAGAGGVPMSGRMF